MNRAVEAAAIAFIFSLFFSVATMYALTVRPRGEYALASAARVSAYNLLFSPTPDSFLNKTLSLPEARIGYGEYTVVVLIPTAFGFEPVPVHFEP